MMERLKKYDFDPETQRDIHALLWLMVADLKVAAEAEVEPDPGCHQQYTTWWTKAQPAYATQAKALAYFKEAP